ncbi:MAG: Ig-like domain-containing protein [Chitinophagaceae bacterium]|nr:Ig-like domain-containing protein [Chitinophagaceae bacterium]
MPKLKKLPYFFAALCLFVNVSQAQTQKSISRSFSFDLKSASPTSAGVYKKDGTLLRTLWGGVKYKAGTNTAKWDGLDDQAKTVVDSDIEIKVLTSNVKYEWEGAYIGNSSSAGNGDTRFRVFDFDGVQNVIVSGNDAFVASGYAEGWPAEFRFKTASPAKKTWVGQTGITGSNTTFVATDGNKVYWAGFDPFENTETFVFASNINNNAEIKFSKGVNIHMEWDNTSDVTYSAISYKNAPGTIISGLAVQKTGNYLFVSRISQNELQVLDKTTGALVRNITMTAVSKLGVDDNDNLWIVQDGTLQKYVVNTNGTISSSNIKITSIPSVGGFDFSPDGSTIAICDVTNQVVKGFNAKTGALSWTLGTPGGYLKNSTVSNDKFYFRDVRKEMLTYLTYLPDGSFYVGDNGNLRIQHFAANRTFIRSIMMLSTNYRSQVDKNVPTRLYADYLEFEIDYSKPLAADNGSWKLKRNWRANFGSAYDFNYKIINIVTFANGRTYARVKINGVTYELVELVKEGVIRFTGIMLGQYGFLNDDGSKMTIGYPTTHMRYALTGFDALNNPVWTTTPEYLANLKTFGDNDPLPFNNQYEEPVTESGKVIYFNCRRVDDKNGDEFHLGAVNKGGTGFLWRTARGTQNSYEGEFPRDGAFDNGNGVESDFRAGGSALTFKDHIFWGYHGEFWKQSQTNIWNHVDGNTGLFVGQFGAIKKDFGMAEAPAEVAGNVFGGTVVEVNGNVYLYHNDEGINNGVHRWKISGLSTVEIQTATLNTPQPDEDTLKGIDLMVGLPRNGVPLVSGNSGWTRTPKLDITKDIFADYWTVKSGLQSYDKFKPVDVSVLYRQEKVDMSVERTLENTKVLTDWELFGKISFEGNEANQADLKAGSYFEVLDFKNKTIARFYMGKDKDGGLNAIGNDKIIAHFDQGVFQIMDKRQWPISISAKDDVITFKYSDYPIQQTKVLADKNADWSKPAKLKMYFFNKPRDNYYRMMAISEMRFASNKQIATTGQAVQQSCANVGSISWDLWTNIPGHKISNIKLDQTVSSTKTITTFQTPYYFGDNYGSRVRGFICVPQTGNYTFFIASDDNGELWLSTDANPANEERIAFVSGWTAPNQYDKSRSQKSKSIYLKQGEKYYIEALHKEGNGGDHLSVAWQLPDGTMEAPIPGKRLVPFEEITQILPPQVTITSPLNNVLFATNSVTIETRVTDVESIVDRVDFYNGDTKIGEAYNKPYSITWSDLTDGTYPLIAKIITDNGEEITSEQIIITIKLPVPEICPGTGGLNWDYWGGVAGNNLAQIPFNYPVTSNTLTPSFATPTLFGDYYGSRLKGYICVAKSGNYTFYLAADDVGALYLSPDVNAIRKQLIAQVTAPTLPEEYTRYPSQKSKKIYLLAGQRYYVEAIHKEWTGADHLSVAWQYEDSSIESPIPGNRLLPYVETRNLARAAATPTPKESKKVVRDSKSLYTITNLELKAFPNPFVSSLNLECYIPEESNYSLQLFTVQGMLLKTIFTGNLKAGIARFNFNASNMSAGVYICRLISGKKIINKQITLVK